MADAVKWTPDQEKAITFRGKGAIVSAAAGSGKTAVLVERVKRMILDEENPVHADEMVISTFTNDAAAEMKARLNKAIDEELAKQPDNRYLLEQRLRLEDAHISTISSFCLDLLRRNSAAAGLQPGFGVLDAAEGDIMLAKALAKVLEDFCESGDPEKRDMLYEWYAGENDARIESALLTLYRFSRNIPDAKAYFAEQLALYSDPDSSSAVLDRYFARRITEPAERLCDLCAEIETMTYGTGAAKFAAKWRVICGALSGITDADSCREAFENGLKDESAPRMISRIKDFDCSLLSEPHKQMKALWEDISLAAGLLTRRSADMRTCAPILEILIGLTEKLDEEFSARKRELGRVDFSDIELMTLRMLRGEDGGPSAAARDIAAGIRTIIVDEFQDSNEIQYEIFRLISDNKKNLYFVGDMKQSIYRFRGADPLVFARLTRDPDFEEIRLNMNFRSCPQVIDSANAIFTGTMTEELGDINYDSTCALVQGKPYRTDESNRTELIAFSGGNAETNRRSEAAYITDRIKEMINSGFSVTEGSTKRPCRYGDFAVIMGKYSRNIEIYKEAFDRAGIPYDAKDNDEYTDFTEVKHALSLLRVIDDPYRDADLAAVLMKEPYLLDAQTMAEIKLMSGRGGSLWSGLMRYARSNERAAGILAELNGYREFAEQNSAERLIRRICDESMLVPAAEASPEGEKKSANLHRLIYYAEKFSGGESAGLYDFIKYMEQIKSGKIKLAQAKGAGSGAAVRLMTIHGSKGLEFPVCFISNLSSRDRNAGEEIICDPVYGIGMKISDTANMLRVNTQTYDMVAGEYKRLGRSEEMRLLYVAATRAKEKMIFTVPDSGSEPDMHYGWILGSRAVDGDPSRSLIKVSRYGIYTSGGNTAQAAEETVETEIPRFTEYRHRKMSEVPAKVTATQIGVKSVDDFSEESGTMDRFMRMPSFVGDSESSRLTGKKRGDAYHKVMELLDFGAAPETAGEILDRLHDERKISDIERSSIDEQDIAGFLSSELCRRAAQSGKVYRESPIFFEYAPEAGEWGIDDWTGEDKPFVQGIADMYFVENGEIVLVDYKTNRRVTALQLTEEYKGQLEIYALALSEATGMRVKQKLLYSFELGEIEV